MFSRLRPRPKSIKTASNEIIYAIGDVHGQHDLLEMLLTKILTHIEAQNKRVEDVKIIFLGDIIDRGEKSDLCFETILKHQKDMDVLVLRGNHEDLLISSMSGDEDAQSIWMSHGGVNTLEAYSVTPLAEGEDSFDFGGRIKAAIPKPVLELLESSAITYKSGNYFFTHAGVKPGVALKKQDEFDLIFIRDEFTRSQDWHGAMIVHGHTIVENVEFHKNRIAVDTGAYKTGKLSCVYLEGETREALSVFAKNIQAAPK